MTAWVSPRIFTPTQDCCQEEVQSKWRFQPGLMRRQASTKVSSSCPSEQVNLYHNIVGYALEIIPKTLATNCGMDVVRTITELRAKHAEKGNVAIGIDGNKKKIMNMEEMNVWEPVAVKNQVLKTAIEASCLLLRIDDVVSGVKRREKEKPQSAPTP